MICLPLGALNIGSIGSLLKIISIFPIFFGLLKMRQIRKNFLLTNYFLFAILSLCSVVWSIYQSNTITRSISLLQLTVLLSTACAFDFTEQDVSRIKSSMIWSSRITLVLLFVAGGLYEGRLTLTGIIHEDPNYLCMYFVFGAVSCIEKLFTKQKVSRLLGIIELLAYTYAILLTGSRGGLLAVLISVVLMIIFGGRNDQEDTKSTFKRIFIICAAACAFYWVMGELTTELAERYTINAVLANGGTGRLEIWTSGIDLYFNQSNIFRQVFGYGSATIAHAFADYGYRRASLMHNIFLENLLEVGLVGFIQYIVMIVAFLKHSFQLKNKYSFCIMVGFVIMSLSTSIYAFKPYINAMLLIIMQENTYFFEDKVENQL